MLSCLLLRSSLNKKEKVCRDPIIAKRADVRIQAVAQVGCGKAVCSYSIDQEEKCLVLCVPSLLAHRDSTRQRLTVTKCQIVSTDSHTGEQHSQTIALSRLCNKDCNTSGPSLSLTKELHAATLTLHAGAISAEDLILHLGPAKLGTMLEIQLEFLLQFTCPPSQNSQQYIFTNKLPAEELDYTASLATSVPIDNVTPTHTPESSDDFRWNYAAGHNVVEIQYTCREHSNTTSGLIVQLSSASLSGCCSISYPQDTGNCSKEAVSLGSNLHCDGLIMLNSTLSETQFPTSLREKRLHPSEFIFVIDCSGSMSGGNIQSAADTLIMCIKSLPPGSYFNVIAFGSNFKHLFHTSSEYTKWSVEKAIQFANQMQASLGGTELLDPLRWIFKQPRCGSLARQIFIVTDGGVTNTHHVLHTVRKNKHQARCHTFGIGPEVSTELVTGIASVSGGRCLLLKDGERLQTKVMEVLTESLQPYISDSTLHWTPPEGFSILDTTPKTLGTVHTGSTQTAFALLKQERPSCSAGVLKAGAAIVGQLGEEKVQVDIAAVTLPPLIPAQSIKLASILDKVATWSKLRDMEMSLASSSRKNSQKEGEKDRTQEPEAKRIKLSHSATLNGKLVDSELSEELIELSLSSGIPCVLTCFRGEGLVQQLLPTPVHTAPSTKPAAYSSQKRLAQLQRMQNRNRNRKRHETHSIPQPLSMASIAKSTLTAFGNTFKTMASSFGFTLPEPMEVHNGHRIEDHLQYQSQKKSALHWDDSKGKLVYPSYYRVNKEPGMNGKTPYQHSTSNGHRTSPSESSSDDEDFISDTDSNSSLDPDWDDLRRPSELRPLIQMQLYSGAWPMVRAFSYAVGVPLDEVRKLQEKETHSTLKVAMQTGDEESNVWTTALALACLEEYFPHLRAEWGVVGLKGGQWIKDNLPQETSLTPNEVTKIAKSLVTRWIC